MAHQLTAEQVDALAAEAAAGVEPAKIESLAAPPSAQPTLAYGAQGAAVVKLVNLLDVLGHNTNSVIKGGPSKLDDSVLVDVRAFQDAADLVEPEVIDGVTGELVGTVTWGALYEAAAAKLEADQAAREAAPGALPAP
jgi:hypothetical protein